MTPDPNKLQLILAVVFATVIVTLVGVLAVLTAVAAFQTHQMWWPAPVGVALVCGWTVGTLIGEFA